MLEFWDGLVNTLIIGGLAVAVFYVVISLLIPEVAPEGQQDPWVRRYSRDRWLQFAGGVYVASVLLEMFKDYMYPWMFGAGRAAVVVAGGVILLVLFNDVVIRFQRRIRPRSH